MNILVIEDDKEIIDFLKLSLDEAGFVVDTAEDGQAGADKALNNNYDLIVLDYNLPQKDGGQICREIRNSGKSVPIIILSVKSEIDDKVNLLNMGADDYIAKPYSFSELLARIHALLRRPLKIEHDVFKIDNLFLDTISRAVRRGTEEIRLSPKEFLLLEYLVRNRGRVLSRTEILEHVWDMNADPFTNTIETHILNLRKKIGKRKIGEFIRTVSGIGYKIE
jgi:two-component system OmpR family response regulator